MVVVMHFLKSPLFLSFGSFMRLAGRMHRTVDPPQCGGDQSADTEAAGTGFES